MGINSSQDTNFKLTGSDLRPDTSTFVLGIHNIMLFEYFYWKMKENAKNNME